MNIQIIGINEIGHESGNSLMTDGRDLPWLQDTDTNNDGLSDIWDVEWDVEFRDVVIVDANNTRLGAFNVTVNDLGDPENFGLLKSTVMSVAAANPIWQNDVNPMDVNNDTIISPVGDVLTCINELNNHIVSDELGNLPVPANPNPPPYLDVNGDYVISPVGDVLALINHLNSMPSGEGEGALGATYFSTADSESTPTESSVDTNEQPALLGLFEAEVRLGLAAAPESSLVAQRDDVAAPSEGNEFEDLLSEFAADVAQLWA